MNNQIFNETNVSKAYFKLAIPLVLSMVVTLIYNLADTYFVAQTNNTDLVAGVSLGMPLFTFLMALGNIFGQGGSSLISRLLGQKDSEALHHVSSFCFYTTILIGLIVGIFMLIFRVPFLYLIGANEATFIHASNYYTYLALGAPLLTLSFIHSNFLRSEGMSKESMIGTILGAIVNIILDPLFISVLELGAAGAAIATIIGYACSDVYFAYIVIKKSTILSIDPKDIPINLSQLQQIVGIGVPAAIVNIMQSMAVIFVNQFLLPYGNDKIAAMGIVLKVSMIALLLLTGLSFGGQPLFGYYYGSNDTKRFKQLMMFCLKFISTTALALTAVIYIFAPQLMRIFMDNASIIADGTIMLRLQVISMVCVGITLLLTIMFQSTGKMVGSFILSISRQGILFIIILFVAYNILGYSGVIASQAISDVLTAIIAVVLYFLQLHKEIL